jgi:hypothetical protein
MSIQGYESEPKMRGKGVNAAGAMGQRNGRWRRFANFRGNWFNLKTCEVFATGYSGVNLAGLDDYL